MNRPLSVAGVVVAVAIVLAGCAAEAKTDAEWCGTITGVFDKFETFAQTPGRDDAEMVERRDAVLSAWDRASREAPEWTRQAVTPALEALRQFADGDESIDAQTSLYGTAVGGVEEIRAQCVADGNL